LVNVFANMKFNFLSDGSLYYFVISSGILILNFSYNA